MSRKKKPQKEVHWEAILCEDDGTWSSLYVRAEKEKDVHEYIETHPKFKNTVVHHFLIGPDDGWNWPTEEDFEPADLLK